MVVNFTETDEIFINLVAKSRDNWLSYWIGRLLLSVGPSEVYGRRGGGGGGCSMFLVVFPKSPKLAGSAKRSR